MLNVWYLCVWLKPGQCLCTGVIHTSSIAITMFVRHAISEVVLDVKGKQSTNIIIVCCRYNAWFIVLNKFHRLLKQFVHTDIGSLKKNRTVFEYLFFYFYIWSSLLRSLMFNVVWCKRVFVWTFFLAAIPAHVTPLNSGNCFPLLKYFYLIYCCLN